MIDPYDVTRFERTDAELQEFLIFCVCVAGKKATMIAAMVEKFLVGCGHGGTPFEKLQAMAAEGSLEPNLRRARLGKYGVLARCFGELARRTDIDLRTSPASTLETLPGVGAKTSRYFILHSRRGARVAVIDTHMLKYLRDSGREGVPDGVPAGRRYLGIEIEIVAEADRLGLEPADFDLGVWSWYAAGNRSLPPDWHLRHFGRSDAHG